MTKRQIDAAIFVTGQRPDGYTVRCKLSWRRSLECHCQSIDQANAIVRALRKLEYTKRANRGGLIYGTQRQSQPHRERNQ